MPKVLSVAEVRRVDQLAIDQYGMSSLVLMENASRSACDALVDFVAKQLWRIVDKGFAAFDESKRAEDPMRADDASGRRGLVTILCGSGNNAGDGLAMARHLQLRGWSPCIWMLLGASKLSPDCAANYEIAVKADLPMRNWDGDAASLELLQSDVQRSCVVVDAMLGSGAFGEPRYPLEHAIRIANQANVIRIAVDIPTGLDADCGTTARATFQADLTCTFVAPKKGFASTEAKKCLGQVVVCSIGIPKTLLDQVLG